MKGSLTALITGASVGIGYELAKLFARGGYNLVLVARSKDKLDEVAAELTRDYRVCATGIAVDLSKPNAAEEVFAETQNLKLNIDVLVNNAGFGQFGFYVETNLEEELQQIQLNVAVLTHLTKLYLRPMVERKAGRILNVASTAAFQPGPIMAVYYATKAYVLSYSMALSNEMKGTGVFVSCLCPGPTTTQFQKRAGIRAMKIKFMEAKTVAEAGYQGLMQGKALIIPGKLNWLGAQLTRFVPRAWAAAIARKIQEGRK